MLPYKARKPIILISMILGTYIFLEAMIRFTHSPYLLTLKSTIYSMYLSILNIGISPGLLIFPCAALIYFAYKNWKEFKALISFFDFIILVLAFLPYLIKG